ncbi:MAG: hypothetical protein ACYST3_07825 [Planctomycetota bacterium]
MKFHPIRVHTYSGYKADERLLKFERAVQIVLGTFVIVFNIAVYGWLTTQFVRSKRGH